MSALDRRFAQCAVDSQTVEYRRWKYTKAEIRRRKHLPATIRFADFCVRLQADLQQFFNSLSNATCGSGSSAKTGPRPSSGSQNHRRSLQTAPHWIVSRPRIASNTLLVIVRLFNV